MEAMMDSDLIPVSIDSIRVSLVSPHRIVVLKDEEDRFLPIWIGPFEAEAITIALQHQEVARPLTHDLLKSIISEVGGKPSHVVVSDLRDDTFFARIVVNLEKRQIELDSRPSDAIALAVRLAVPIFVATTVMERAAVRPSEGGEPAIEESDEKLGAFRDLIQDLDLDGLGEDKKTDD
jgi:uncharacterized protein